MKILIVNDDGIKAPGIKALVKALRPLGDITVAAPHVQQTAQGHAVTIRTPIKVKKISFLKGITGYEIWGTPRDCVDVALRGGLMDMPDLVVSGINEGPNLGSDCVCSGTVAAATVAYLNGIPTVAVSLDFGPDFDYTSAGKLAREVVEWFIKQPFRNRFILSLNVPNIPVIKGTVVALPYTKRYWRSDLIREEKDGYIFFQRHSGEYSQPELPDNLQDELSALQQGYAVLSPLDDNVVDYGSYDLLNESWCKR